ncbi:uncharacterized protein CTRU02_212487 [Colletotrichum truncatum]|uniref:Uncharacterized protein n=2 Tax=Colletotrichum truncatum TaxID=5467 RepID=A0ACC3YNP6_COLTU|nr:uncharacterized protein CTRU02_13535 [Colletotrichum truncatum]XP_036584629.1 uncharacterized protein CTRU02_05704 [Colletotrichum truncatum]KAF6783299.1 hypothetical protein CTRU02_13535 [Colletotrichum truncatum]KAF6794147.1 hypothetical protein CTRU02_05704 [Colletotrichum truncatum]
MFFITAKALKTYSATSVILLLTTMSRRISISDLLTPAALDMETNTAKRELRSEDAPRLLTPPAVDTPLLTDSINHHADSETYHSNTTGHNTDVRQLLPPAKLISTGEPTLEDMFAVQALQPSFVTSSSMALQQQMFDDFGSLGLHDNSHQMLAPFCYNSFIDFSFTKPFCNHELGDIDSTANHEPVFLSPSCSYYWGCHPDYIGDAYNLLDDGRSGGYVMDSVHPGAYLTSDFLASAPIHNTLGGSFQPQAQSYDYGIGAQSVTQQGFVFRNDDNSDIAGEENEPAIVAVPSFLGQITSSDC